MKDAVTARGADSEGAQVHEQMTDAFLRRYDQLVKRADRLNPPHPKRKVGDGAPDHEPSLHPTPLDQSVAKAAG